MVIAGAKRAFLFGFHEDILIALHAFIKKTQKVAPTDLALARLRFKEMSS
jgi:phage-related protein